MLCVCVCALAAALVDPVSCLLILSTTLVQLFKRILCTCLFDILLSAYILALLPLKCCPCRLLCPYKPALVSDAVCILTFDYELFCVAARVV